MSLENNTADISKEAEAAARWWREVLKDPKFDRGSKSKTDEMSDIMVGAFSSYIKRPDDEMLDRFEEILKKKIVEDYHSTFLLGIDLVSDNGACGILAEAAEEAGFKTWGVLIFPSKTCMLIRLGCVRVGHGYKVPFKVIYGEDPWKDEVK